jgi:hypothetical protein
MWRSLPHPLKQQTAGLKAYGCTVRLQFFLAYLDNTVNALLAAGRMAAI